MLKNKTMFLVPGMLLGLTALAAEAVSTTPAAASAAAEPAAPAAPDYTIVQADLAKQELLEDCKKEMEAANACMTAGEYDNAIKLLRGIWDKVNERSGDQFAYITRSCEAKIKRCYYMKAKAAVKKADASAAAGDYEAAIKICREIQEFYPEDKDEIALKIAFYERKRNAAALREDSSIEKLDPGKDLQDYQIEVLLEQGRVLAKRNDLLKARRCFEEVLLLDPYNDAALQDLLGVNDRIREGARNRANDTARHMMGQVEWSATIPIMADAPADASDNQLVAPVEKQMTSDLEAKLKAIVIPSLQLQEMTFQEAMDALSDACRQNDPAKKGANFVVKSRRRSASAEIGQQQEDESGAGEPQGGKEEESTEDQIAEFIQKKISVYDALARLQHRGDLTFKIVGNAVYIAQRGVPLEGFVVKEFPSDVADGMDPTELKEQIAASAGVSFPRGTYIIPQPNHVVVCHTPENLKKIEAALQEINEEPEEMVQVMFKFIEVNQKDLDEMAFSWQYARYDAHTSFSAGDGNMLRHYYSESADFKGDAVPATFDGEAGDPEANYNFYWQDGHNKLNFSVYALDWSDSSDVLYSPRVTTLSGQTAVIDMSEKHYYPGDWETIDSESNDNYTVYVDGSQPTLDDEQDLGIKFSITPEVSDRQIHVPLDIPIKQFYDWLIVDTRSDPYGLNDDDDGEYIKKPIFNKRTIQTDVTVKDGETILIGSIANDVSKSILDKIPILGDIPVIGRFFQSRYTNSEKSNLLIFMTCRIIKPDGTAKYPDDVLNEGSPTFSHH